MFLVPCNTVRYRTIAYTNVTFYKVPEQHGLGVELYICTVSAQTPATPSINVTFSKLYGENYVKDFFCDKSYITQIIQKKSKKLCAL